MFFTRIGIIFAHIGFWPTLLKVGAAYFVAYKFPDMEQNAAFARRYFGTANTGEAIDGGLPVIIGAVALGILAEISSRRASRGD